MRRASVFRGMFCAAIAVVAVAVAGSGIRGQSSDSSTGKVMLEGQMFSTNATLVTLLKRADVQSEISMTVKQKSALSDVLQGPQALRLTARVDSQERLSDAERQKRVHEQIAAQISGIDDRIKHALRPEQYSRLMQLRLQWMGPLGLANPEIASALRISGESRSRIGEIAGRYNQVKGDVLAALTQKDEHTSPDGSQRAVTVKLNTRELENPVSPLTQKLSAARRKAEQEIIGLLSADEKDRFREAQGAPFKFRADIPGFRF